MRKEETIYGPYIFYGDPIRIGDYGEVVITDVDLQGALIEIGYQNKGFIYLTPRVEK